MAVHRVVCHGQVVGRGARALVPLQRARVVDEHGVEVVRPACRVIDLIGLIDQPDRRSPPSHALSPALHEAPAMHHQHEVGREGLDLVGQARVLAVGLGVCHTEFLCRVAQAVREHVAAGHETVGDDEHAGRLWCCLWGW